MGTPIPSVPLPGTLLYVGSAPKPIPAPGNAQRFVHMGRGEKKEKKGCEALRRQPRARKPAPFYAKTHITAPGLPRAPSAVCGVLASSSRSGKTKPNQVVFFFNPGAGRGGFVSPAGRAPRPRQSLHKLPCPSSNGEKFFWGFFFWFEKYPKPAFQTREKKKRKTQLTSRQIF